jgi:hypothetical protein
MKAGDVDWRRRLRRQCADDVEPRVYVIAMAAAPFFPETRGLRLPD